MQSEILPTLDDIARDPGRAAALPRGATTALLLRCAVVQSALAARLADASCDEPTQGSAHDDADPLDADAIARAVGQSRRWVFRHAKDLPFVTRTGRKSVVGSRAGLQRWLKARRA